MIIANCRRTTPLIGSVTWGNVRWSGDLEAVRGKRVLLFVHGIRETEARLRAVYSEIASRAVASHDPEAAVGFVWPAGSTVAVTWPFTLATALTPCGQRLRDVIVKHRIHFGASLDVNAHSLGAAVLASALRQLGAYKWVRHVYLMAPAISQSDLAQIAQSIRGTVHVCYNHEDPALMAYRLWPPSNWIENAVGLVGPDKRQGPNVRGHDFSFLGPSHGGYRRISEYYQIMRDDPQ